MNRVDALRPPRVAEALIGLLVPREQKASVLGDLLEEYRDAKVPALGRIRADRWYVHQAFDAIWRLAAFFCIVTFAVHTWREAIDEVVYTDSYFLRSYILSYSMIGAYVTAGAWAGWRVRRIVAGTISAGVTCLVGWSGALLAALVLALLQQAKYHPGGIDELYLLPFMTLPLALALGTLGATVGVMMRRGRPLTA